MKGNFDTCLREVLHHEGGFVNHPRDPGGMTNLGVTKATYEAWVGYPVNERIMRSLTPAHVKALYKTRYWDAVAGDLIPLGLDLCVFDFGVNAGPSRAARYLQVMVGAKPDGRIGPMTIARINTYIKTYGIQRVIDSYQNARIAYYKKLRTFPTFGKGWLRRVEAVRHTAKGMT